MGKTWHRAVYLLDMAMGPQHRVRPNVVMYNAVPPTWRGWFSSHVLFFLERRRLFDMRTKPDKNLYCKTSCSYNECMYFQAHLSFTSNIGLWNLGEGQTSFFLETSWYSHEVNLGDVSRLPSQVMGSYLPQGSCCYFTSDNQKNLMWPQMFGRK